uniref:Rab11 family-interacting protein 1 n=1 Tax=Ciona intestinalis TaxID=7719 RepID=F6X728_CIOIN|nr:rab11 family-interacting protein 1 isoform X1 [Ciona intestinalis]|eukprot:XP_002126049.1 rab11 family-interacting protein 1 isoform X1 [Ciona intestinalis]
MWSPTDVVVTVRQARNLLVKGKSGSNEAYATIEFCKDKYLTSTDKSTTPRWFTQCSFTLPQGGVFHNKIVVHVTVMNKRHGKLGLESDDFLGQVSVPLSALNSCDNKERARWYELNGKKSGNKKERGEVEISFKFISQEKSQVLPVKKEKPMKIISTGFRSKLRRRSEDEDSGVGISDGDRTSSMGRGRSYENLSMPSITDQPMPTPFERTFRTSSTNSSPGSLVSARGSAKLKNSNLSSKAMSVEVLHRPPTNQTTSLYRSNSGGNSVGGGSKNTLQVPVIKKHIRNHSLPENHLKTVLGQLRKNDQASKSALCVNGSHFYVPGTGDSGHGSNASSPEVKPRSTSMTDIHKADCPTHNTLNKNDSNSVKRNVTHDSSQSRMKPIAPITALYKPKNYYRLDVKELGKVSTIHEEPDTTLQTMSHKDLVKLASKQKMIIADKNQTIRELEDYIDSLLVKVMVCTPDILDVQSSHITKL